MLALTLTGCNSTPNLPGFGRSDTALAMPDEGASNEQLEKNAEQYAKAYASNQKDKGAAINLSRTLRALDRKLQAIIIMRQIAQYHPNDRDVLIELGKALADGGKPQDAAPVLAQARNAGAPDWRLLSTYGTVLDQLDRHKDAQSSYQQALQLAPDEPAILNNLGLSYALDQNLPQAESTLRKAAAHPRATRQVKENFALVLGLQGKFEEAEAVARTTLPADAVSNNTSYLKQMMSQPANWAKLQSLEAKNKAKKKP